MLLGLLGRGDVFGEGLLFGDYFRRASITAESDCYALQLPLDELRPLLNDLLPITKAALRAVYRSRLVVSTLGRVPLLSGLSPFERVGLAKLLERRHFGRGDAIVLEGDAGDSLYLIEEGQVAVEQGGQVIAHLDEGDFFGEMSLLSRQPHNATVRALTPLDALVLPGAQFHTLLAQRPDVAQQLQTAADERRRAGQAMRADRARAERLELAVSHGLLRGSHLLVRDPSRCVAGCRQCETACATRHGQARLRVGGVSLDGLDVVDACRQCRFGAECVEVCPEDAFRWNDQGALYVTDNCTGCGECAPACPYGAIAMQPSGATHSNSPLWQLWQRAVQRRHIIALDVARPQQLAAKCDLCHGHDDIACLTACPTGALRLVPVEELFPL